MLAAAVLLLTQAASATVPSAPPAAVDCSYDQKAMLSLELRAFDQDMTGGWRPLSYRGCYREAAELIRAWRSAYGNTRGPGGILTWHEGQMRAMAGEREAAVELFEQSRVPAEQDADFGWNHYVDGSIAFLRGDRATLDQAYDRLSEVPRPDNFNPVGPDGKPMKVVWPPNLNVLEGFRRCWGQTYEQAYACAGRFSE